MYHKSSSEAQYHTLSGQVLSWASMDRADLVWGVIKPVHTTQKSNRIQTGLKLNWANAQSNAY